MTIFDAIRYGLYSFLQANRKPVELRIQERFSKIAKNGFNPRALTPRKDYQRRVSR